jgi:hypothetical protein
MVQAQAELAGAAGDGLAFHRARRSMMCLPFRKAFYAAVAEQPISSIELCRRTDWRALVFVPFGADRAEDHFRWLIRLGVLRREVDGQGLTERVRLTPLGRQVLASLPAEVPRAGLRQRLHETLRRHRPRI